MNEPLFLIAHKVRGEAAFDVAIEMERESGERWWIIPTSGHRAYPFWSHPMDASLFAINAMDFLSGMPADLRDHYSASDTFRNRKAPPKADAEALLKDLGL